MKKGLTLTELIITVGIIALLAGLFITSVFTSSRQSGPAVSVSLTHQESESVPVEHPLKANSPTNEKFICESVKVDSLLAQGSDIQKEIVQWQRKNPSARIVSIVPVKKNDVAIGALVITAYAPR